MADSAGIASLAVVQVPPSSRLMANSCCPDKDLVVVFSATGGKSRMSLWKLQGSKKWEVDLNFAPSVDGEDGQVVNMAWSPDCQTIVLVHHPPRMTFHSIQTGQIERQVQMFHGAVPMHRIVSLWWLAEEKKPPTSAIPDIFKRAGVQTGNSLSILKMLPLLDNITDTAQTTGMPDAFGFRTTQAKPLTEELPFALNVWPSLPTDRLAASIEPPKQMQGIQDEGLDENEDTNNNSLLMVTDTAGTVHCLLDGRYPLGPLHLDVIVFSAVKTPGSSTLSFFPIHKERGQDYLYSALMPIQVDLALLSSRLPRDVAKLSSAAYELCVYAYRIVENLKTVWMGSDSQPGARDPGIKWLTRLANLQPENHQSQGLEWAKNDLLQLLVTERSTEPVTDFIGAGEQMSDRGLSKWENNVTSALIKLRDQPEQRIAPACQRLHLALEEVLGMSKLPHSYAPFQFDTEEIRECLNMLAQIITASSWLTSVARRELARFKEFMRWLRFEINNTSAQDSHVLQPRHDILEVTDYICHGLIDSPIDKWFTSAPPSALSPVPPTREDDLEEVMRIARGALSDPNEIKLNRRVRPYNLGREGRNMHALLLELAEKCSTLFSRAAEGTARSALNLASPTVNPPAEKPGLDIRDRTIVGTEKGIFMQLLTAYAPTHDPPCLCLFRLKHQDKAAPTVHIALLECQKDGDVINLIDYNFFDDNTLVIVYRHADQDQAWLGLVNLATLDDRFVPYEESVQNMSREELTWHTMQRWQSGELVGAAMPLTRWRALAVHGNDFSLAVNGRAGRRAACVLLRESETMETLDLAADEEDTDDDEDGGDDGEDS